MRTTNYSTYLSRVSGLIGVASSDLQSEEKTILNGFFNHSIRTGWESNYWLDLVSKGEARFVGNLVPYPNAYNTPSSGWIPSGASITGNAIANPLDGRTTSALVTESATNAGHSMGIDGASTVPVTSYTLTAYARANGRGYFRLRASDATSQFYAFFHLSGVGSVVSTTNCTATIGQVENGFYRCAVTFTTSPGSNDTVIQVALSNDGSTLIYLGDGLSGIYFWGITLTASTVPTQGQLLAFDQTGETEIEAIFQVYKNPPSAVTFPAALPYYLTPDGIQLVGSGSGGNPVYIDYRGVCPDYEGSTYSVSATYAVGDQIYFTDSTSIGNYWKCIVATTAGQSPESTPASWSVLAIPQFLLDYCVYDSYASWLRVEGRNGAAEIMEDRAKSELDRESDRQERQMGDVMPTKFQTHVSVQPR